MPHRYLGSLLSVLERTRAQSKGTQDARAHQDMLQAQHALAQSILDKRTLPPGHEWGSTDAGFQDFLLRGLDERYPSVEQHATNQIEARLYSLSLRLEPRNKPAAPATPTGDGPEAGE